MVRQRSESQFITAKPLHDTCRTFLAQLGYGHPPPIALVADAIHQCVDGGDIGEYQPVSDRAVEPGGYQIAWHRVGSEKLLNPHQGLNLATDQFLPLPRFLVCRLRVGFQKEPNQLVFVIEAARIPVSLKVFKRRNLDRNVRLRSG
jgi:hypothetical protein